MSKNVRDSKDTKIVEKKVNVREGKVNEIKQILDEAYSKGTIEKPYSVLFISELDDDVKCEIEEWCKGYNCYSNRARDIFKIDNDGYYIKTNDFGFDASVKGHDVVFQYCENGYRSDIEYKSNEHKAFKELVNKNGLFVDKELKLIIYSELYPLWNNNMPLFNEENYSMFDEVILLKMDVEVFKDFFIKHMDSRINGIIRVNNILKAINNANYDETEGKARYDECCRKKKLGLFVLNHPKFHFVPLTDTGKPDVNFGGHLMDGFCPVEFYYWIDIGLSANIRKEGEKILCEILKDYKNE